MFFHPRTCELMTFLPEVILRSSGATAALVVQLCQRLLDGRQYRLDGRVKGKVRRESSRYTPLASSSYDVLPSAESIATQTSPVSVRCPLPPTTSSSTTRDLPVTPGSIVASPNTSCW